MLSNPTILNDNETVTKKDTVYCNNNNIIMHSNLSERECLLSFQSTF